MDSAGAVFYADEFALADEAAPQFEESPPAADELPVAPFPSDLVFHSKPGAPNVLFLNFSWENVSITAWNISIDWALIKAVAFGLDDDFTTYSSTEQQAIKRIWQRISEDYASFNIDVTTERPVLFGARTAHVLITHSTDADGNDNPVSTSGGGAYINAFGKSNFASYRPAWVYFNRLARDEAYISEAASHEFDHNLGLSHDGTDAGDEYYNGHGGGCVSWAPSWGQVATATSASGARGSIIWRTTTRMIWPPLRSGDFGQLGQYITITDCWDRS